MKNEQHQQSASILSQFNLHRLVFNISLCTFAAATLAFILTFYIKDYVSLNIDRFSSHFNAYYDLRRHIPPPLPPPTTLPPPPLRLSSTQAPIERLEDEELLKRAWAQAGKNDDFLASNLNPKVAFLFLSREGLGLRLLWEKFFEGSEGLFSIYVHSNPSYNGTVPESSVFHGRRITSKAVEWGQFSMVEAERRLLANALLDATNRRFVLLSETTIPLYNFSTIYNYLINSRKSFVEVYDLASGVGRGRYNWRMHPNVTLDQWRKGSQWFEIDRDLAQLVVSDQKYFPIFSKYCTRSCYADEHYLPTFVHIVASERNSDRTVTWVDWSKHGPHPSSFNGKRVTEEFLNSIRTGTKCEYNGEQTSICFLFARKFTPDVLDKLLRLAPKVLGFNGS
ncbi:unnamed protein product [Rhodiola kirilowii]